MSNVVDFLLNGKPPDQIALKFIHDEIRYGELQNLVDRAANLALNLGARKGDRAILVGDNSVFWVAAYLGIMRAALVAVPLPPNISTPDLSHVIESTDARIAFVTPAFASREGASLQELRTITSLDDSDSPLDDSDSPALDPRIDLPSLETGDLAALMFTSGSTGRPRGVMISHRNIMANTDSIIESLQLTGKDRVMAVLPFYYCFGTSLLHTHLRVGGSVVVDSRFMYPEVVLQRMIDTECTGFAGVPSHFQILMRNSTLAKRDFPHLRYVQQAGGRLAPSFIRELTQALPDKQIFIMYGQTEATARLSFLPPSQVETKIGSIGKGLPGVQLRVVNEWGSEVGPGEVGEIVAAGDNVAQGYWRASEETASSFRDGALYTGDLATVDADGFIYIVDRAKDFLKCGGERVSCRQIEEKLLGFEELLEAAVIGIPDDVLGESVKAFVVPRNPNCNGLKEQVALFCKSHLPPHVVPKEIVVLTALPKNSAGKVMKESLRSL